MLIIIIVVVIIIIHTNFSKLSNCKIA